MINHRNLAHTDLLISEIGLGTMNFGTTVGETAAHGQLSFAVDNGINLIDTAPAYGISEQRLGGLLKGQRHNWVICSKVGEEFNNGESFFDFSVSCRFFSGVFGKFSRQ